MRDRHTLSLTIASLVCAACAGAGLLAQATQPKKADATAKIVGAWNAVDRHASLGSLFQPVHGVRKREAVVHFTIVNERLAGQARVEDHAQISFQERWKNGLTELKKVRFVEDTLHFEVDIEEWRSDAAPIAVEEKRLENKGTIRVDAKLAGDRLIGQWRMLTVDGAEVFRGEWEAVRATR